MSSPVLRLMEPFSKLIPTTVSPSQAVSLKNRTVYTAIALFIYLVCSQIPLYGMDRSSAVDPLHWMRVILASSKGTLMDLGLSPILSAGWTLQLLRGAGLIAVNSEKDSLIYDGFERTMAMTYCITESIVKMWYGNYGSYSMMSWFDIALVLFQLAVSGFIVIQLDEMLYRGYGLGSGISLFIVANTAQNFFWKLFSPITKTTEFGVEFEGSFVNLTHQLLTKSNKWAAIMQAFTRSSNPNLFSLMGTLVIFFIVIYLRGMKKPIKLISQGRRGFIHTFNVDLLYTSTVATILESMVMGYFFTFLRTLSFRFKKSALMNLIAVWDGENIIGGFCWFISPPVNLKDAMTHSFRTLTYMCFMCAVCAFFAKYGKGK